MEPEGALDDKSTRWAVIGLAIGAGVLFLSALVFIWVFCFRQRGRQGETAAPKRHARVQNPLIQNPPRSSFQCRLDSQRGSGLSAPREGLQWGDEPPRDAWRNPKTGSFRRPQSGGAADRPRLSYAQGLVPMQRIATQPCLVHVGGYPVAQLMGQSASELQWQQPGGELVSSGYLSPLPAYEASSSPLSPAPEEVADSPASPPGEESPTPEFRRRASHVVFVGAYKV
ncbi:uncharacterized protein Tco025E_05492 [Trypanosoma conorhini]|uniref:Uncharacterized protein n=1 Tax=Trypanosoma conorhini TaxID=83891 RepID=A0A3R7N3L3_9TRYP|nr:uncharacterized protein Tco025E_05492 [Trypanosoma conorhini]RNF15521.1 hypothetical protein Tco025E_05492 [Trypanosoma conorhini]